MHMVHGYSGWGWMVFMMVIYLMALLGIGVYLIQYFINGNKKQHKDPLEMLNEQLVKGEISEETYDRLKRKLKEK